jgi:ER-bound oxygenase mpaB/B'/Rubber oxygenase, catalytic domain
MTVEPWSSEHMEPFRHRGDDAGDEVARSILEQHLEAGVNAAWHRALSLAEPGLEGPEWQAFQSVFTTFALTADEEARLFNGQKFFATWGPILGLAYLTCSLPNTYAAANGVKVLWGTARLQTDTERRVIETCRLLLETMKPQKGLDEAALATIQRVRLMHAYVRELTRRGTWYDPRSRPPRPADSRAARVRARAAGAKVRTLAKLREALPGTCELPPRWDEDKWGTPLNQDDLVATLMAFAYLPIWSLQGERIEYDQQQADDYVFSWKIIGKLLGVHPDLVPLLPQTVAEGKVCWEAFAAREQDSSCHGREMTMALIRAMERHVPGRWLDPVVNEWFVIQLSRRAGGSKRSVAELFKIRRSRFWRYVYGFIRKMLRVLRLQENLAASKENFGYDIFHWVVTHKGEYRKGPFELPESLRDVWGLTDAPAEVWRPRRRFAIRARPLSQNPKVTLPGNAEREERVEQWAQEWMPQSRAPGAGATPAARQA